MRWTLKPKPSPQKIEDLSKLSFEVVKKNCEVSKTEDEGLADMDSLFGAESLDTEISIT